MTSNAAVGKDFRITSFLLTAIFILGVGMTICLTGGEARAQHQVKVAAPAQQNVSEPSAGKLTLADWLRMMR